jgi:microcystin-dependent protein
VGGGVTLAESGGVETVTLTTQEIPSHNHQLLGSSQVANDPNPQNNVPGESSAVSMYQSATPTAPMAPQSIGSVGGSQPHSNFQPYLCVDFIISLFGIFPSQT